MATYPTNGLTLDQANTIIAAARAKGRELSLMPLTVVVLDAGGQMKATRSARTAPPCCGPRSRSARPMARWRWASAGGSWRGAPPPCRAS